MAEQPTPLARLRSTYVKDFSFENIAVQNQTQINAQPQFEVNLNINNRKNADDDYEVSIKISVTAKSGDANVYVLELDHAGRFELVNIGERELIPFLYIECPRLLFPFTRRIVSDVTRDGGYPPLNLDHVDFVRLFQNSVRRQQEAASAAQATPDNDIQ